MRFLEILLLVVAAVLPFLLGSSQVKSLRQPLAASMVVLLLAHFFVEGGRWQMAPIYVLHSIGLFLLLRKAAYFTGGRLRRVVQGFFLLLLLALGATAATAFPVFELPTPTGPYAAGARYVEVVADAAEPITPRQDDQRTFVVKIWYPASVSAESREPYLNEAGRRGFARKYGLPKRTFDYLDRVETHTFLAPEVAAGTFPVLIFSHGYYANAFGYHALLEDIVSQGFVVLNINHTYESVGTQFLSGEIKFYDQEYERAHHTAAMAGTVWEATENFKRATTLEEKRVAIQALLKEYYAAAITARWERDIDEVVRLIPDWAENSFLAGHLDTTKIGAFGHSQGGAAVGQALLNHPKIAAGVNLDGVQWGDLVDRSLSQPFLLVSSDWPDDHPNFNEVAYQRSGGGDFYSAIIRGAGHASFMDIPFLVRLPGLNEAGSIRSARGIEIAASLVVGFFNRYLNGAETSLLQLPAQYSELEVVRKMGD